MYVPKFDLKQLSQGALCGAPIGGGLPSSMLGASAPGESLSLALALGAFVGAGVWTFRRWGGSSDSPAPDETQPEAARDSRRERGLATG